MNGKRAFIYLSGRPEATTRRIEKFRQSLDRYIPQTDFFIVSYQSEAEESVTVKSVSGESVEHYVFGRPSLATLGYKKVLSAGSLNFNEGFVDLPVILIWKRRPEYTQFWVSEDDVDYTGQIGELIRDLDATNGDRVLACTHLRKLPSSWDHSHQFTTGSESLPIGFVKRVCFLPFFFISQPALQAIDEAYARGWKGHNEMTWPVILDLRGLPIRDIGGNGPYVDKADRNNRYIDLSPLTFDKKGSFGTLRIRMACGTKPNTLWHPVKTRKDWLRMNWKRTKSIVTYYGKKLTGRLILL